MRLLLDAGALVALERGDRDVWRRLGVHEPAGELPVTHAGVVGQVWRGGKGRQARLVMVLRGVEVIPLDEDLARRAGVLLGRTGMDDVIDAALVALAEDGDRILTSDLLDMHALVDVSGRRVEVVAA